jgi:hypothetical protein
MLPLLLYTPANHIAPRVSDTSASPTLLLLLLPTVSAAFVSHTFLQLILLLEFLMLLLPIHDYYLNATFAASTLLLLLLQLQYCF